MSKLFTPFEQGLLRLRNRVAMAPMTRYRCENGVPTGEVLAYYERRARADVGLILTEGTTISHPQSRYQDERGLRVPDLYRPAAVAKWAEIVDAVHDAGAAMAPQLWHIGLKRSDETTPQATDAVGPSGLRLPGVPSGRTMTQDDIDAVIASFAEAAGNARAAGFDAIALHGAHGYLIDLFFWHETNKRSDRYNGDMGERTRFACEIVRAVRQATGHDFPIIFRISQGKQPVYDARVAETAAEMEQWLAPLVDAGVDIIDCSTRRFWEPAFAGSPLSLAGWAKKLTGKPSIAVGGVGLNGDFNPRDPTATATPARIDAALERLDAGEFDLLAVGRALLADPDWLVKVRNGDFASLVQYDKQAVERCY